MITLTTQFNLSVFLQYLVLLKGTSILLRLTQSVTTALRKSRRGKTQFSFVPKRQVVATESTIYKRIASPPQKHRKRPKHNSWGLLESNGVPVLIFSQTFG